jgi:hypothetical protein
MSKQVWEQMPPLLVQCQKPSLTMPPMKGPLRELFYAGEKQNSAQYKAYCLACVIHHSPTNISWNCWLLSMTTSHLMMVNLKDQVMIMVQISSNPNY